MGYFQYLSKFFLYFPKKDDYCWIGELGGHQGWFPAKLVDVLDERSKEYSFAGKAFKILPTYFVTLWLKNFGIKCLSYHLKETLKGNKSA